MLANDFTKAMEFRHACKLFDETKKIDTQTIKSILEIGRLSPSSFGMEPWKFLVITNKKLKEQLRPLCWNQAQITSCSHLVIILAAIDRVKPSSGIPQKMFARRDLPQEKIDAYINLYGEFLADTFASDEKTFAWTSKQCYIAAANMMTGAASFGVDSCAIEGFEKKKVEKLLELDTKEYQVALLLPFGYRVNPQPQKVRLDYDEIVEEIV
jgi:nitroreductase